MYTTILAALLLGAPPQPPSSFATVLHVRLITPAGVNITVRPGAPEAKVYKGTANFAVRPGYVCRVALSNLRDEPNLVLHPSLEVYASLFLPSTVRQRRLPGRHSRDRG